METNSFKKEYPPGRCVELVTGDLTRQEVDAIVNAANSLLAHGGGVAGAIVRRGGQVIQRESDDWVRLNGPASHEKPACTGAGDLPCQFVIHAVGPVWGEGEEEQKLARAIQASLELAENLGLRSIAFPAISTGIFGFPIRLAAGIFARELDSFFTAHPESNLNLVRMVLIDQNVHRIFIEAFSS